MAHFKFLLDRGVGHLARCFPAKRVVTINSLELPPDTPDDEIVWIAADKKYLLVAANRRDFARIVPAYIATSTKKPHGCRRVCGLILLVPNDQHVQERVLKGLEGRMLLDGEKINFSDVHDRDLLVQVEADGTARVTRLPRCPHCQYDD